MSVVAAQSEVVRFAVFEVDLKTGELRKHGLRLKLQDQPFRILAMLLEHPGELVTREQIKQKLWPEDTFVDFEHSVNTAVRRLRDVLGDDADTPRFVETLPRRGYRFVAAVNAMPGASVPILTPKRRTLLFSIAAAILLLAVLAAGLGWRLGHAPTARITSLAVLPLANFSADPEQEFFADGITEELTSDLSSIDGLRVISRTSVMHYKDTKQTLRQIARELNVNGIIEGSVQRDAGRVRITVQLVQLPEEHHLWSASYDRELKDILPLRIDLARNIAGQVRRNLTPKAASRIQSGGTNNPVAYEAFLKARHLANRDAARSAVPYFQQAIDADPNYALGYAYLALTQLGIAIRYGADTAAQFQAASERACSLASDLSECHVLRGDRALYLDRDWNKAEAEYRRAAEINPGSVLPHSRLSAYAFALGRLDMALEEVERARELDPLAPMLLALRGRTLRFLHRYEDARDAYAASIELDPGIAVTHDLLGATYVILGQPQKAVAEWLKCVVLEGFSPEEVGELNRAYATGGLPAFERLRWQTELARNPKSPLRLHNIYTHLGEYEKAIRFLQKAYDQRLMGLVQLRTTVELDPDAIRLDPRVKELIRKQNYPD